MDKIEEIINIITKADIGAFTPGIHGLNKLQLRVVLKYLYKTEMKYDAVEIGTWNGITTSAMAMVAKHFDTGKKVYGIDSLNWPFNAPKGEEILKNFRHNIKTIGVENYCELIIGRSDDTAFDKPLGFLFIDGDHSYEQVTKDIKKYVPLVVSGGYIVFHDYNSTHPQTIKAIDEAELGGRSDECWMMYVARKK